MASIAVVIPTYKPGKKFISLLEALGRQTVCPEEIVLMNTEQSIWEQSLDVREAVAGLNDRIPVRVYHVTREEFDHGATRDLGITHTHADFCLCMTDDAVPCDSYLVEHLAQAMEDPTVAVAYGRQLANPDSGILERYTREFNYPEQSCRKELRDLDRLGIKTYFCSNVCAMYRRATYDALGGFIHKTIFNEDMIYAAAAVQAGYAIQYVANARVYHSHRYSCPMQMHRNFDLGVSQADHPEVFAGVPSEGEGMKMVKTISKRLAGKHQYGKICYLCVQSAWKLLGFRLGRGYRHLPKWLIRRLTLNHAYWK